MDGGEQSFSPNLYTKLLENFIYFTSGNSLIVVASVVTDILNPRQYRVYKYKCYFRGTKTNPHVNYLWSAESLYPLGVHLFKRAQDRETTSEHLRAT